MERSKSEKSKFGVLRFKKAIIAVRFVVTLVDSCTYQPSKYKAYHHNRLTKKLEAEKVALQELLNKSPSDLQVQMVFNLDYVN
jgi:hypothetical protein